MLTIRLCKRRWLVTSSDSFPAPEVPGSLLRQKEIVERLEQELEETEIAQNGDKTLVLDALRYAAALRDPMAFINEGQGGDGREGDSGKKNSVFAWRMFQAVVKVLYATLELWMGNSLTVPLPLGILCTQVQRTESEES